MEEKEGKVSVTFIMPALNEEANISRAVKRSLAAFDEAGVRGEVLVVNDGSSDRTPEIVEEIREGGERERVRMIHHSSPQGIGASFRDGLAAARGEAVAMMPGDDENDPAEILRYLGLLKDVDMVVPFVFNRDVRARGRNLLSACYRAIINLSFGVGFRYTNGTVLYRRRILSGSPNRSDGFFFQTENVVRAARKGYLFAEVPYRLDAREGGASKAVSWKSLKRVARDYLSLANEVYFRKGTAGLSRDTVSAVRRKKRPV